MTDEELIARLRAANAYNGPDFNTPIADPIKVAAADRIEQLAATNEALVKERDRYLRHLTAGAESINAYKARAERLEAIRLEALRQARDILESHVAAGD